MEGLVVCGLGTGGDDRLHIISPNDGVIAKSFNKCATSNNGLCIVTLPETHPLINLKSSTSNTSSCRYENEKTRGT